MRSIAVHQERLDTATILDAVGEPVVAVDAEMQIVLANRAATGFFDSGDLVGRSFLEFVPERLREAYGAGFTRYLSSKNQTSVGGPPVRLSTLVQGKAEREIEVQLTEVTPADEDGVVMVASIRDATESVALERRAAVADYLRAILAAADLLQRAPDLESVVDQTLPALCAKLDWDFASLWMAQPATGTMSCETVWCADDLSQSDLVLSELEATLRRRVPESGKGLVGRCWSTRAAVVAEDLTDAGQWPLSEAERLAGMRAAVAFPLVGRSGVLGVVALLSSHEHPVDAEVVDLLTAVGHQAGMFFDRVRDADDLRRNEKVLREGTALLSAQIHSAPQAVLAVSDDGKVLACNRLFEELWGLSPGSVKAGDPSPSLQPETLSQVKYPVAFERALRWGHAHPDEIQHLDVPLVDGRVIQGVSSPIVDDSGGYHGRIWFLTDDTGRLHAEAERNELMQRLQQSQRSQAFLLDASRVLAGAHGYLESLERLAAVAVPTLGDICLIDLVDEDGALVRMAARHADPGRQSLVDELRRRFPPDPAGMHPSADVTRTRRSRWSAEMTDDFLRATCRNPEHFALVKRLGFTSYMTVPLVADDEVLGTVTLVSAGSGRRFGPDDLALAEDLAARVAHVVAKARRYDEEHRVAHTLQASLLPADPPPVPGLRLARRYEASPRQAEVGGDWYDVIPLPGGAVRVAVGDVAGHDIAAAAAMGQLRSACRALTPHAASPAQLVKELRAGWELLGVELMATLVVAQIDPTSGALEIASAGHPPPVLVTADDATFLSVAPGPPLGAPGAAAPPWRGTLSPGAAVLLYTDGLVEERSTDLTVAMERLLQLAVGVVDPERLCDRLLSDPPGGRDDDIALLALTLDAP